MGCGDQPPDGSALAAASKRVTLGGSPAEEAVAGLAAGFAGLLQINFRVPAAVCGACFSLPSERKLGLDRPGGLSYFDASPAAGDQALELKIGSVPAPNAML